MQQVGVDIIEINRIQEAISEWGDDFLNRIYTEEELRLYRDKLPSLAARFSGKEAVIKALDSKIISLREIEILSDATGKPNVRLYGEARKKADDIGIENISISLSHCHEYAVAFVVGESHLQMSPLNPDKSG
ncbi:MAG: holo-ACP synthase [Dehalococcoidales bacterium]|nr:holo-ACP synthase [Dehalococcoidales bacterium]